MRIESSTIGMDSARSFKASRTSYGRFVLKDYVQGGTNTGAGVAGQQSEMGNMKGQTTQNQGKNNESGKQSQVLTTGGVLDLRERVESMRRTGRVQLRSGSDNAMGKLDDDRLSRMVADLEKESAGLKAMLEELNVPSPAQQMSDRYTQFFELARSYTHLDELDRDTLVTFVDRIEIGPKIYENGSHKIPSRANQPYRQSVHIFYKFIGELAESKEKDSAEKPA